MKQEIEQVIRKNLPEKHSFYESDSDVGFDEAIDEINTSLIADEVLKVVGFTINKIYTEFENHTPPLTFNKYESEFNNGMYKGLLKAIETVCVNVLGKNGDDLLSTLSPNKENKNNGKLYK